MDQALELELCFVTSAFLFTYKSCKHSAELTHKMTRPNTLTPTIGGNYSVLKLSRKNCSWLKAWGYLPKTLIRFGTSRNTEKVLLPVNTTP